MADAPSPKIDDAYWFSVSEDLVGKSLGIHEAAAAKLQNLVLWLWGVYTTYTAVGIALAGKSLPLWAALLIALASAALIAVYWGTIWVQTPVGGIEFDPRSPDDIRYAFTGILKERSRRFRLTLVGSVLAAFTVALALVVASMVKAEVEGAPALQAAFAGTAAQPELTVLATVEKGGPAVLRVEPDPSVNGEAGIARTILPTEAGVVQASVPLAPSITKVRVSVEWSKDGLTRSMSRAVQKKSPAK